MQNPKRIKDLARAACAIAHSTLRKLSVRFLFHSDSLTQISVSEAGLSDSVQDPRLASVVL